MKTPSLVLENVHHGFDTRQVLRDVSLTVHPGEVHALLGENASGKTTAIRIALGLLAPDAGRARLFGVDALELSADQLARIGYVGEEHVLPSGMCIDALVELEAATRRAFDRGWVDERLACIEVGPRQTVDSLSRGQRARVALALALGGRPELIVLDDPSLGLDARQRRMLLDDLIGILAEREVAVLLTSHLLHEVERVADRVSILRGGAIAFSSTVDEIRTRAERRLVQVQAGAPEPCVGQDAVLSARRRGDAFEVVLWSDRVGAGRPAHWVSSEAAPVDLEEFFLAVTAEAEEA